MKILIVTMSLPYPPASGGAIRVHGIAEGLNKAGHDVTLLCFNRTGIPYNVTTGIGIHTVPMPPQRTPSERLRTLLLSRQADIALRHYDRAFGETLRAMVREQKFDVIQFEGIESICYQPIVRHENPNVRCVFDTFNAEYNLQRNIFHIDRSQFKRWPHAVYSFMQIGRIHRYERRMSRMADAVIAVSGEDAGLLEDFREDGRLFVVPNGIWVDRYAQPIAENPLNADRRNIVFTGKMDYRPNVDAMVWFVEDILPRIPEAHLTIVGQKPHPRIARLAQQPNVTITGWVDSVLPYLQHADVYVAPLRMGSGTRLKLLEAMAAGCAIVATSTASAGLNESARSAMSITDDPLDFARQVNILLDNPAARVATRAQAEARVRAHYDWSVLIPRLVEVYRAIGLEV
ncbi:MAG: glycosyltransferase [Chloroflexota bacterium]